MPSAEVERYWVPVVIGVAYLTLTRFVLDILPHNVFQTCKRMGIEVFILLWLLYWDLL